MTTRLITDAFLAIKNFCKNTLAHVVTFPTELLLNGCHGPSFWDERIRSSCIKIACGGWASYALDKEGNVSGCYFTFSTLLIAEVNIANYISALPL